MPGVFKYILPVSILDRKKVATIITILTLLVFDTGQMITTDIHYIVY